MTGGIPPDVMLRLLAARNAAAIDYRRRAIQAAVDRSKRMAGGITVATTPKSIPLITTPTTPSIPVPPKLIERPPSKSTDPATSTSKPVPSIPKPQTPSKKPAFDVVCPNCGFLLQIPADGINCQIFRHAALKSTGQQVNPHAPKVEIDALLAGGLIYGCGRPFRFDGITATTCDYI